jgi:adenine-specific DNA-methyltransferase
MATRVKKTKAVPTAHGSTAKSYKHPEAEALMRPDIGTQAQFKKKKEPKKYRYDSSLSPSLEWDGQNPAREQGEALIKEILDAQNVDLPESLRQQVAGAKGDLFVSAMGDALNAAEKSIKTMKAAADKLRRLSKPFLNWAGKVERLSFDVPTLPLFVHERLSTKAILETLKGHQRDKQLSMFDLFGDPGHSITDQVLKAYEHKDRWVNRLILGDSMVVMNSLLNYEGMGGKVQMIFMDPPYGVKFGSNFQPFVRKRDVSHGDDEDMTREPEMVQAYRDTWELGLHSYLTYLRDRLHLCKDLLAPSGSIFVQISDQNVHLVRQVLAEVFGTDRFVSTIIFQKTSSEEGEGISNTSDFLLWFCNDPERFRSFPLFRRKTPGEEGAKQYTYAISPDFKKSRKLTAEELASPELLTDGWRVGYKGFPLSSQDYSETRTVGFEFEGKEYWPSKKRNRHWSISPDKGLPSLVDKGRIYSTGESIRGIVLLDDMPATALGNTWSDTGTGSFTNDQIYVVQTGEKVIERCILMTTEPGDLVFDPTCGSGTTAYVAEKWGRRWITTDVSRVPLALARQRLLTSTYSYFRLKDENRGPASGMEYKPDTDSANRKADGYGIVSQHTLSSIAGDEDPQTIILRENPEVDYQYTRVTGPFCVESSIPTPSVAVEPTPETEKQEDGESASSFAERMLEILRKSPVLHAGENKTLTLKSIRPPAKALTLSAEGIAVNGDERNVAFVFGPENGSVTESLVFEAAREAYMKGYAHLFVIGFAVEAKARMFVQKCDEVVGIPATYVQATTDLTMSDLLKTMRSSQIFSVCGLPDVNLYPEKSEEGTMYRVQLLGLDVFDPVTMQAKHYKGDDAAESDKVPAWFLDTDYNGLCFHVSQAFFPRTAAWDSLRLALKGTYDDSVWDHLAGMISEPFEPGDHKQIAVKVIDDRGNELLVVKSLSEAVKQPQKKSERIR